MDLAHCAAREVLFGCVSGVENSSTPGTTSVSTTLPSA